MKTVGLQTQKWNNNILSFLMLGVLPLTLIGLVTSLVFFGLLLSSEFAVIVDPQFNEMTYSVWDYLQLAFGVTAGWLPVILLVALYWYLTAWIFGDNIMRTTTHAMRTTRKDDPRLYNLVENLSLSKGIKMPKISIIETEALNSLTTGVTPNSYGVTVTRGLLYELDDAELEAVLAHEISHIENNDARLMMVVTVFAGLFETILSLFKGLITLDQQKTSRHEVDLNGVSIDTMYKKELGSVNGVHSLGAVLIIPVLVLAVFALIGSLISKAVKVYISRRREYVADVGATELTHNPEALIRALRKIKGRSVMNFMPKNMAGMCIASPVKHSWFQAHPLISDRVEALKSLAGYQMSDVNLVLKKPKRKLTEKKIKKPLSWDNFLATTTAFSGKMKAADYPEVYLNPEHKRAEKPFGDIEKDITAALVVEAGAGRLGKVANTMKQARKNFGRRIRKIKSKE